MIRVIKEDFSDFKLEEFPYDKEASALGEYHHFMPKGYKGNFYDPICNHQWRSQGGSWMITEENGVHFMEQNRGDYCKDHFSSVSAILVHKQKLYVPYELKVDIRPLSTKEKAGVCFNYIHNKKYYSFSISREGMVLYKREQETVTVISKKSYDFDSLETYHIKLSIAPSFKAYVNDELEMDEIIEIIPSKIALIAKCATRFSNLEVEVNEDDFKLNKCLEEKENNRILQKQTKYSALECIHKIKLSNFGSGRQFRFAIENGKKYFLFCQHQKRIMRDSFVRLSCITVFDYEGNIVWQKGEPANDLEHTLVSCDLPVQIADINGDGLLEVIFAMDFIVYIASLQTGKILSAMPTPNVVDDPLVLDYPFDRLNPDGIRVADFEGVGYKGNFILKDRYRNVWAYRAKDSKLLWRYHHKNTGHFPYIEDMDHDGKDEMLVGYDFVDHDGKLLWSLPFDSDHTDEILFLKTQQNKEKRFYLASGNEGFNVISKDGKVIKSNLVGHAQRVSAAPYDSNKDELQIAVTSFWGADQIIYLFDGDGNLLHEVEMQENGNTISPVSYDGTHCLILTNPSKSGGLLDNDLDCVVLFPEDGHPDICTEVLDIDEDGIDEILCWNQNEMWIYKASNYSICKPFRKYPSSGFSNYRGEFLSKIDD